jgi:ABC-type amino acid transport substrate-binding protein
MATTTRSRILGRGSLRPGFLALIAVMVTTLTACSASPSPSPVITAAPTSVTSQPSAAASAAPSQAANPGGIYANAPVAAASDIPAGSTMDKIKQRGNLIIGGSMDAPLWSQIDPTTGQFTGFDADMGKLLAYYITGKPDTSQVVSSATQTREALLGAGTVDVVFQTYTITVQRATQVDFAGPYFTSGLVIATAKGQPSFTTLADLAGKTVIAGANTPAIAAIKAAAPSANVVTFDTDPKCVQALEQGRGVAYVQDQGILLGDALSDTKLQIDTNPLTAEPYGIGLKFGDTQMKQFVNGWLQKIYADGVWTQVWKGTIGTVVTGNPPTPPTIGSAAGS